MVIAVCLWVVTTSSHFKQLLDGKLVSSALIISGLNLIIVLLAGCFAGWLAGWLADHWATDQPARANWRLLTPHNLLLSVIYPTNIICLSKAGYILCPWYGRSTIFKRWVPINQSQSKQVCCLYLSRNILEATNSKQWRLTRPIALDTLVIDGCILIIALKAC